MLPCVDECALRYDTVVLGELADRAFQHDVVHRNRDPRAQQVRFPQLSKASRDIRIPSLSTCVYSFDLLICAAILFKASVLWPRRWLRTASSGALMFAATLSASAHDFGPATLQRAAVRLSAHFRESAPTAHRAT